MSDKIILKDNHEIHDELVDRNNSTIIQERMKAGPKRTRIRVKDPDTGEILGEWENKVVISGSAFAASRLFNVPTPFPIPNYNTALDLQNSVEPGTEPENDPIICLFCVGDSGCGELDSDVFVASFVDRIAPVNDIMPFRYIPIESDITASERANYFGRKEFPEEGMVGYYFKKFDNEPQIYMRYVDGTELTAASIYNTDTTQDAECFVQLDLLINRLDFRDYFDKVLGWDKARVSTISLCSAWYTEQDGYKWYQDILPFTKLNFSLERLVDNTKSIAFEYALFF